MNMTRKYPCVLSRTISTGWNTGFTLLEVTVSLIVAAILGTLLIQFMGTNLSGSSESVVNAQQGFQLREVMEQITRDYRNWRKNSPGETISDFENDVNADYGGNVVTGQTEIDPGNDGDIEILEVTITDGNQTLVAFFTK